MTRLNNTIKKQISLFCKAYEFATIAHEGVCLSGEDYIVHPLQVSMTLAKLELDVVTIAAGIRMMVEDTDVTLMRSGVNLATRRPCWLMV